MKKEHLLWHIYRKITIIVYVMSEKYQQGEKSNQNSLKDDYNKCSKKISILEMINHYFSLLFIYFK
jgi:hypothetical protein